MGALGCFGSGVPSNDMVRERSTDFGDRGPRISDQVVKARRTAGSCFQSRRPVAHRVYVSGPAWWRRMSSTQSVPGHPEVACAAMPTHQSGASVPVARLLHTRLLRLTRSGTQ